MALLDGNNDVTVLESNDSYDVYSLNSEVICLFCVPKGINGSMSFYLDLNMVGSYKELLSGTKSQGDVINLIKEDYNAVKGSYGNSVLVVPNFDKDKLSNALNSNDKQTIFNAIGEITKSTKRISSVLSSKGIAIDNSINVLVSGEVDNKFALWLSSQNIGRGINLSDLKAKSNSSNPFSASATSSNPFGNSASQGVTSIFDSPQVSTQPVQTVNSEPSNVAPTEPVQTVNPEPSVVPTEATQTNTSVIQTQGPAIVQNVPLESPNIEDKGYDPNGASYKKVRKLGHGGYVNIVVLMAILVGVTILSIQLGKYLYSVYG